MTVLTVCVCLDVVCMAGASSCLVEMVIVAQAIKRRIYDSACVRGMNQPCATQLLQTFLVHLCKLSVCERV